MLKAGDVVVLHGTTCTLQGALGIVMGPYVWDFKWDYPEGDQRYWVRVSRNEWYSLFEKGLEVIDHVSLLPQEITRYNKLERLEHGCVVVLPDGSIGFVDKVHHPSPKCGATPSGQVDVIVDENRTIKTFQRKELDPIDLFRRRWEVPEQVTGYCITAHGISLRLVLTLACEGEKRKAPLNKMLEEAFRSLKEAVTDESY